MLLLLVSFFCVVSVSVCSPGFLRVCNGFLCIYDGAENRYTDIRGAGANIYWLGLDENVPPATIAYPTHFRIADALNTTASVMGATFVRSHTLGISVGNPLSFEPTLGVFNHSALLAADYAIYTASLLGLRLQIPLTDNYHYYHGGKHTFTDWLGVAEADFYTNPAVIQAFKEYIYQRLTHVNPFNKLAAAEDPTIAIWETGNELQAPANWTEDIAAYIKSLAPNQLVLDGNYGINPDALAAPHVDLYSDHFYPVDTSRLAADVALVASANKSMVVGEFGWTSGNVTGFLNDVQSSSRVAFDAFWSLFPHNDDFGFVQHNDGFTLHWPGDSAEMTAMANLLRQHAYSMANQPLPQLPSPAQPLITSLQLVSEPGVSTSGNFSLFWRGSAGSSNYTVEVSTAGGGGKYTSICDQCVNDDMVPFNFTQVISSDTYIRIRGANADGKYGVYSVPVTLIQL